jgi:hypothetical protein
MKKLISIVCLAIAIQAGSPQEVTIRGEVLDQHCYVGAGPDHADCSTACINMKSIELAL